MTFIDVCTDAYIKNGILAPGESLSGDLGNYAMREANRMLDQWNIQHDFVWTTEILVFDLTARPPAWDPDQTWYTIGPVASDPNVDFDTNRPTRIARANILLTASSPSSRVPLQLLDDLQWSDQPIPALPDTIPMYLYNDGSNPVSKLYLSPYPTEDQNQLELFVWNQVSRFTALSDTFEMPPGYEDAFMLSLSERLIEGIREIPATLAKSAAMARSVVRSLNARSPKMSTVDSGMPGSNRIGQGNYFNGWPTTLS